MTWKTYCGNLLWQSGLTLLVPVKINIEKAMIEIARLILGKECEGYGVK